MPGIFHLATEQSAPESRMICQTAQKAVKKSRNLFLNFLFSFFFFSLFDFHDGKPVDLTAAAGLA
jgi:hypothetical protein